MTKTQSKIYLVLLVILILGLIITALGTIFFQKNQNTDSDSSVTPTFTPISPEAVTQITWEEAVNLLQSCQIKTVFQKHNLTVTLTNKNNQIFETIEPNIDDIFDQTNHLRSDCNDIITTITE